MRWDYVDITTRKGLDWRDVAMMMLDQIETGRVPVQTCPLFLFVAPRAVSAYKTSFSSLDHQLETETSLQSLPSSSGGFVCYKETKGVTFADVSEFLPVRSWRPSSFSCSLPPAWQSDWISSLSRDWFPPMCWEVRPSILFFLRSESYYKYFDNILRFSFSQNILIGRVGLKLPASQSFV